MRHVSCSHTYEHPFLAACSVEDFLLQTMSVLRADFCTNPSVHLQLYSISQCMSYMQKLPATVPQLVEASPSATEDGALLLGSHRSSVYVVDGKSGVLLRVLPPHGQQALDQLHAGTLQTAPKLCEYFTICAAKHHLSCLPYCTKAAMLILRSSQQHNCRSCSGHFCSARHHSLRRVRGM